MALVDLIARLEQDADLQVAGIARAATEESAAIASAADRALAARAQATLAAARAERRLAHTRALSDHRRELRARELTARHALLDRVFAQARQAIARGACLDEWAGLWPALAAEALSYTGAAACRVRATPAVTAILRAALPPVQGAELVEDDRLGPGLVVEALDGSVRIDATIDALLSQRREQLALGLLDVEATDAI